MSIDFRGISSQAAVPPVRYSTVLLTTAPLHLSHAVFLHIQDGLLAKEDEKLPLARHVVGTGQHLHFVEDFVLIVFMRAKEVVVSDPEGKFIVGAIDVVEAVCVTVRCFIGTVQPFNHLFEWTVFLRNSIVVGKPNHLSDMECKGFPEVLYEFHCGERIGAVTIRNELKVLRQLCKALESHPHSEDTGADATVVRYLITDDGTACGIHDEPDIGFNATDFNISFIRGEGSLLFVWILVDKRLNADSGGFAVVGNLLV